MTKPKTLKDIVMLKMTRFMIRQEAIKWIKEDMEEFGLFKNAIPSPSRKWMKRLNITERDLE